MELALNSDEWERIRSLHARGESIKGIARMMKMSRNTVRRALTLPDPPQDLRGTVTTLYDTHGAAIRDALRVDPDRTVAEIAVTIGWSRSPSTLAKYVARARTEITEVEPPRRTDRSTTAAPTGLPHFSTSFIGRRNELGRLRNLLGKHRLITITGPGGIGKTRFATYAADQFRRAFPDGVRFIELASLRSPDLLPQAILEGLGLAGRDQQGATAEVALIDHLRDRGMLLVLDNCEHLVDVCATLVHTLLQNTTELAVVVTSREVLSLPEEFTFPLSPLPVPGVDEEAIDSAIALFESRADAVLGGFAVTDDNRADVRRVCEGLEGIPLAIELACARLPVLSVADLADRLDHRLDLLTTGNRGTDVRHRSMLTTLDWSHEHCTAEQQLLWARASVFAGGFDLSMAEQICADDDLPAGRILDAIMALVSKSILLREDHESSVRFRMLETVREYGQGRLDPAATRHLQVSLMRWTHTRVAESVAAWHGPDQLRINAWFRANRANLRKCLQWSVDPAKTTDVAGGNDLLALAAEVVAEPWFLWAGGFSVHEHRLWLGRVGDALPADSMERGRVLATLALIQTLQGDREPARTSLDTASHIAEHHDDGPTRTFSEPLFLQALAEYDVHPPRGGLRSALEVHLGMHYALTGELDRAQSYFDTAHEQSVASGELWFRAYAGFGQGAVALLRGDPEHALELGLKAMRLIRDFDDEIGTTLMIDLLGWCEAELGRAERAAVLLGSVSTLWGTFGRQLYGASHWVDVRQRYAALAWEQLGDARFTELSKSGSALSVSATIAHALAETVDPAKPEPAADAHGLTAREREVAVLAARGLSNREIAALLVLSPRTVEGHVEHVLQKLLLTGRGQIADALKATGQQHR